jgi:hypothetical protein
VLGGQKVLLVVYGYVALLLGYLAEDKKVRLEAHDPQDSLDYPQSGSISIDGQGSCALDHYEEEDNVFLAFEGEEGVVAGGAGDGRRAAKDDNSLHAVHSLTPGFSTCTLFVPDSV